MEHTETTAPSRDRRSHPRVRAFCAVELSSAEKRGRCGVTRDASGLGLRIVTASRFPVGEALELGVYIEGTETRVRGRVVRVEENTVESNECWRYRLSVALDEPLPDDRLAGAAEAAAQVYRPRSLS